MRIHVLQHADFETEAAIGLWAKKKQFPVTRTLLFNNEKLPDINSFDLLCIMGGPMNIYEEKKNPFLSEEKLFIKKAINEQKKILGICLGAQLVAEAFGATVTKNKYKEIGWHTVFTTKTTPSVPFFKHIQETFHAFHWHGDTFTTPSDAIHVFQTEGCINQGFVINNSILALQFHLEMTLEGIKKIIKNCNKDITPGKYVVSIEELGSTELYNKFSPGSLMIMEQILDTFQKL